MPYADVALNRPLKQTYQYEVPANLEWGTGVGALVEVNFSNATTIGCVTALSPTLHPELEGKRVLPIRRVVNPDYYIPEDVIELARWMADYYYCGIGEALSCVSMVGFNEASAKKVRVLSLVAAERWREQQTNATDAWKQLTPKQRRLAEAFLDNGNEPMTRQEIHDDFEIGVSVINRSLKSALIEESEVGAERSDGYDAPIPDTLEEPIELNERQAEAFEEVRAAIDSRRYETFLLHGVTGSGKTEIYLQAIGDVLRQGRQAICLVPEIALTPQTVGRFRNRFGDQVGVYHSRLSIGQKYDLWRAIEEGRVSVLVGARSALFAPFKSLGLIVIDEEHETSYKQSDPAPRYHARDVAIVRARQRSAAVILGSATPAMESYHNAEQGKYTLLTLPHRVSRLPLASTRVVDMGEEVVLRKNTSLLSRDLEDAIAERLEKGEQTILFLNRRGFSNFQMCSSCRTIPQCPDCDVGLTYHKGRDRMVCHYCERQELVLRKCPSCGADELSLIGMGTERVEETLHEAFPEARVLRVDLDTTGTKDAFIRAWKKITSGDADIILGTQMIAKGLHLENVTLVGVISADFALFQPDFRAAERSFCLLTQVTGRAGRGEKPGEVFIQTYQPRHYSIEFARQQDYAGFYDRERKSRQLLRFPPHQRLISLLISDRDGSRASSGAKTIANMLKQRASAWKEEGVAVFGATPAPMSRLRGRYRWRIVLRGPRPASVRRILTDTLDEWRRDKSNARLSVNVDVDPIDLM